ncbi:MAG: adenosylmethionine--8-amino-7-oxononanoate transaminase [bacterium]
MSTDKLSMDWCQRDLKHLWHPCTQMKDHESLPLVPIARGDGIWLEGLDGRRYLDAVSSWWVNLFGHCNPIINQAVKNQLDSLEHVILAGFTHKPAIRLAEKLVEITPQSLDRCFFADNGSSAVEVALKMSFHYWRNSEHNEKTRFIAIENSYHGETLGALSVGDVALYKETYAPLLLDCIFAPGPDCWYREAGESWEDYSLKQANKMQQVLEEHSEQCCAIIVEPLVQCAGSMRMYHPVYLSRLRTLCDQYNVHLIFDEIAVGFGRTGTLFASEQANISPDFMCLSKGLTGGYLPLSAVMTTEKIYQAFYDDYENLTGFLHSHSYTGNPLACAAALATIEIFQTQPIIENNLKKAQWMADSVAELADHPHVGEIRQTGMILAIEMVQDKANKTPFPWQQRRGLKVYQHALTQGVLLRPLANVVYFMPPYIIDLEQVKLMGKTAIDGIHQASKQ